MTLEYTPRWDALRDRLRTATRQRGKRAALARIVGVPLRRVSEWLNGHVSPGAEVTLRLLEWVTAEEDKQKSPGSVFTTARAKTRSTQSRYERRKTSPPKQ